jgi:penicillin-binding protein 1A
MLLALGGLLGVSIWAYTLVGDTSQRVQRTLEAGHFPYTPLSRTSPFVQEAAIASQDKRFYTNSGVDPIAMVRAVYYTLLTGRRQGASTITEQLAKNVYFQDVDSPQTDIATKFLALFLTLRYPKPTILELYLNDVIFGPNARGIGAASAQYFGVMPDQLSVGQAAYLIGLLNEPGFFARHPEAAQAEADNVLAVMRRDGYITSLQRMAAEIQLR